MPDIELGSDWIVGFPGETDADHEASERFLAEHAPAVNYVFKYDPRPGTRAAERPDDVPREVKQERNQRLLAAGERAALGRMRRHVGVPLEVFVEEALAPGELRARSVHGLQVRLAGPPELVGRTLARRGPRRERLRPRRRGALLAPPSPLARRAPSCREPRPPCPSRVSPPRVSEQEPNQTWTEMARRRPRSGIAGAEKNAISLPPPACCFGRCPYERAQIRMGKGEGSERRARRVTRGRKARQGLLGSRGVGREAQGVGAQAGPVRVHG